MAYVERVVDRVLDDLLSEAPAVLLVGPRASGKTTTAARRADFILRLDDPAQRQAVLDNPAAVLAAHPGTLLIDEWQFAPAVLGAVKREVDAGAAPGRFLLTGSTRADLTADGWPATGRVLRVPVWNLSQMELYGSAAGMSFVDRVFSAGINGVDRIQSGIDSVHTRSEVLDVGDYVDRALAGGFPALSAGLRTGSAVSSCSPTSTRP